MAKRDAEEAYEAETDAIGSDARGVDNIVQVWASELIMALREQFPQMTPVIAGALVRALVLNASAAAIRANVPQDEFMRLVCSAFARAMRSRARSTAEKATENGDDDE
jgi:hypothetical protein